MHQFSNCSGTDRTTTMLGLTLLALAVLLSERAPKSLGGPATDGGTSNDTTAGGHWNRLYGPAVLTEEDRFYTVDYVPTSTLWPRSSKTSKTTPSWHREPRFISFETKDNSIEVEIDFAIPFLSIPVQKSVSGVMSSVLKGTPLLNVNLGAVAVAGVLTLGGALVGAAARTFSNSSTTLPWPSLLSLAGPLRTPGRAESRHEQDEPRATHGDSLIWAMLGSLDRTMERYDIDTAACVQRTICWYVKEATVAVAEGKASSVDTIVEGLSRADWMGRFITGTAVEQAILMGRKRQASCEKSFPDCAITSFVEHIVRMTRQKR